MNSLLERLKLRERRGSKPRCHLLTHGSPETVAARLTALVSPFATLAATDCWMPRGIEVTAEDMLPQAKRLLAEEVRRDLGLWWLAVAPYSTRTPNWDIASTCTTEGRSGILLIEAKAHEKELIKEETGKPLEVAASDGSRRNHVQIGPAIQDASNGLAKATGQPWSLSRDKKYQMSNRFAWSWKLADLGIPVVLVYLGFLNANEMRDKGRPFADAAEWQMVVKNHSKGLFGAEIWGQRWNCAGQPFIPLIRSLDVPIGNGSKI